MRILYDSKNPEFKTPFGTLKRNQDCKINIHIPMHCRTTEVTLEIFKESGGNYAAVFLSKSREYDEYEVYSAQFHIKDIGLYFYRFYIKTQDGELTILWYLRLLRIGLRMLRYIPMCSVQTIAR